MGTVLMDSLMNNNVKRSGGTDEMVSHRFRARESGNVSAIQLYWIASPRPGYALGNGGRIRLRIYPDDGSARHFPDLQAAHFAAGEHLPRLASGNFSGASSFYTPVAMTATQPLVKGQLYHVVYENIDANPEANWISTDDVTVARGNGDLAPWLSGVDWAVLRGLGSSGSAGAVSWQDHTVNFSGEYVQTPNLQITMNSGRAFGSLRTEGANTDQPRLLFSTASTPARTRIVPDADWEVVGFSVNSGFERAGSLLVELTDASGNVLRSQTITQATPDYSVQWTTPEQGVGLMKWYHRSYTSPITLTAGQTYYQRYTPQGSASVVFASIRDFRDYPGYRNLDSTHSFTAQHLYNGAWLDFYDWNHGVSKNVGAWRDVFHLVSPSGD